MPPCRPNSCLCIIESAPRGNLWQNSSCLTGCARPSHRPVCQRGRTSTLHPPPHEICAHFYKSVFFYSSFQQNDTGGFFNSGIVGWCLSIFLRPVLHIHPRPRLSGCTRYMSTWKSSIHYFLSIAYVTYQAKIVIYKKQIWQEDVCIPTQSLTHAHTYFCTNCFKNTKKNLDSLYIF